MFNFFKKLFTANSKIQADKKPVDTIYPLPAEVTQGKITAARNAYYSGEISQVQSVGRILLAKFEIEPADYEFVKNIGAVICKLRKQGYVIETLAGGVFKLKSFPATFTLNLPAQDENAN